MNHHSFLIKQAMIEVDPRDALTGLEMASPLLPMGLTGAATAALSPYQNPELEQRRDKLKDVLRGGLYGLGLGVAGAAAGAIGGGLLGAGGGNIYARIKKLPVAPPFPAGEKLTAGKILAHWSPGTRQHATLQGAVGGILGGGAAGGLGGSFAGGRLAARHSEEKSKEEKEKEEELKKRRKK